MTNKRDVNMSLTESLYFIIISDTQFMTFVEINDPSQL